MIEPFSSEYTTTLKKQSCWSYWKIIATSIYDVFRNFQRTVSLIICNTLKKNNPTPPKTPLCWALLKFLAILCFRWKEIGFQNCYQYFIVSFQKLERKTYLLLVMRSYLVMERIAASYCYTIAHAQSTHCRRSCSESMEFRKQSVI